MGDDMTTGRATQFAQKLIEARRTRRPVSGADAAIFADGATADDAVAVQAAVAEAFGPVGAWKTAPAEGRPLIAPILAAGIRSAPATYTTTELAHCGIELEIGFRLDRPCPSPDAVDFATALRAAVTPLVVIEVVDTRLDGFDGPPLAKLADNQMNGGLVLGDAGTLTDAPAMRLAFDGKVVADGAARPPGGDAWASLENFARHVGTHCGGFQVGQVLITGSLNGMPLIEPGTSVEGSIEGLGTVRMTFAAG